ncbi:hypothetical protein KUCAC02_035400 [Chaenocephalus aceratus]|nr:hypothetical protein KUCAC02_035400 [Chaenocephalus aceratus]
MPCDGVAACVEVSDLLPDIISNVQHSLQHFLRRYRSPPADIRRLAIGRGKVTVVHQRRVLDTPLMHRCVGSHGSASAEKREDLSTRIGAGFGSYVCALWCEWGEDGSIRAGIKGASRE